jgi:hypothetical protein
MPTAHDKDVTAAAIAGCFVSFILGILFGIAAGLERSYPVDGEPGYYTTQRAGDSIQHVWHPIVRESIKDYVPEAR